MDKGYENKDYWTEEGWNWKKFRGARHPTFWVCEQGTFDRRYTQNVHDAILRNTFNLNNMTVISQKRRSEFLETMHGGKGHLIP